MNFVHTLIARRTFLQALPVFGFGLQRISAIQTPIERGRFGPEDLPSIRDQLLLLVNYERRVAGVPLLALDDLASRVALAHAGRHGDLATFSVIGAVMGASLTSAIRLPAASTRWRKMSRRQRTSPR